MSPKFRVRETLTRDSKRKDRETTLTRKQVRSVKYEALPAGGRLVESA